MVFFHKIHERRIRSGLEWPILGAPAGVVFVVTVLAVFHSVAAQVRPADGPLPLVEKSMRAADILSLAFGLTLWFGVFTVAVGCIVVAIMKGPGCVADAYSGKETREDNRAKLE